MSVYSMSELWNIDVVCDILAPANSREKLENIYNGSDVDASESCVLP